MQNWYYRQPPGVAAVERIHPHPEEVGVGQTVQHPAEEGSGT